MPDHVRRATPDDAEAIADLIGEVFPANPKADPAVLRWQYWDNPFGEPSSWVVEDAGRMVAHYTAFALPGLVGGESVTFLKSADAATLESHRGQGIFPDLVQRVTADAEERGIPVTLYSPSNPSSASPLRRVGMVDVADVPVRVAPRDIGTLAGRIRGGRSMARPVLPLVRRWMPAAAPGLVVDVVDQIDDGELDALWSRHRPDTGVDHSAAWWRWRYARPGTDYTLVTVRRRGTLVGAAAAVRRDILDAPFAFVLDVVADTDNGGRTAIRGVAEAMPGVAGVAGIALPRTDIARHLAAARLVRLPKRVLPKAFTFGVLPTTGDRTLVSAPWRLTWCDLDHL